MACLLLFSACYKRETLSIIPVISIQKYDVAHLGNGIDSFNFTLGYKDGDGDIGYTNAETYKPFDTGSYFYSCLFVQYLELQNGKYVFVDDPLYNIDTIQYSFRLPALNDSKKPQPITGNINFGILLNHKTIYKTFKFRIFLYDKALHESNIIETNPMQRGK